VNICAVEAFADSSKMYLYRHTIYMIRHICFLLALAASTTLSRAQSALDREATIVVSHTADFEITGDGRAASWKAAQWIDIPHLEGPSTYNTRVKLLYSDKGLYTLFNCEDRNITSTMNNDFDSLWREDVVEIFLWPDETYPLYLEYELSPRNRELILLIPQLNGVVGGWMPWGYTGKKRTRKATSIVVDARGKTTAWIGEFFIPYALMHPLQNVPPTKGTRWKGNIYRCDYDDPKASYWAWQPVGDSFHEYLKYGTFVFE